MRYITKKNSWLRFVLSFLFAAGIAVMFWLLLAGPRLGLLYDFLLRRRGSPRVSGELLIIDSYVPGREIGDDILTPGTASSLLYTLAEFGAETLIIQVPILGLSPGGNAGEEEILYRFDEEFSLLSRNIRSLFDAIRTGSVAPGDAAEYVGQLVELSGKGKERLVSALVRRDEAGAQSMEKAAAFFGQVRRPGDLRVQLIRTDEGARPGAFMESDEYSRVEPDPDGILRRAAPVLTRTDAVSPPPGSPRGRGEHIIYGALKSRYKMEIRQTEAGLFLAVRGGAGGTENLIPLDRNGALLFEMPQRRENFGGNFRRIGIADFLAYDEADRDFRRLLSEGEALGIFQGIEGERQPGILYDYALSLREEFSISPGNDADQKKRTWIEARRNYFKSLEDFLYGPAEMNLIGGYEKIIAESPVPAEGAASPGEAGIARIAEMRDTLIRTFIALRMKYHEILELREKLESSLEGSFCILGRASGISPETQAPRPPLLRKFPGGFARALSAALYRPNPSDTEVSALLANSILTGQAVKPGEGRVLLLGSLGSALLICFFIKSLRPAPALGIGALLTLLAGTVFSLIFIFSGIWLDPLVPAASGASGVLFSFAWALVVKSRYTKRFRLAFGPFVSRPCLKSVIRAGQPLPSQTVSVRTAVVAVKSSGGRDVGSSGSGAPVHSILAFREKVSEIFRKAGATVTGTDGDIVSVCFGSPLERVFSRYKKKSPYENNIHAPEAPALRAVEFVSEIAGRPEYASWQFGIDLGNCAFAWTALSGYFALGAPVRRARTLAKLAGRYHAQIVISASVNEALPGLAAKKLGSVKEKEDSAGEAFYRLALKSTTPPQAAGYVVSSKEVAFGV